MKPFRQAKLKALAVALIVSVTLLCASVHPAHAYDQGAFAAGIIALWVTYVTAKTLVCTPVAAFNASKNNDGFGGAFKECRDWKPDLAQPAEEQTASTEGEIGDPLAPDAVKADEYSINKEDPK